MRAYLDSAPVIYWVEDMADFKPALAELLVRPDTILCCSELVRLECRVKPMRDQASVLLAAFDRFFSHVIDTIIPISRPVVDRATDLRARYAFKTPDALHLAAAIEDGCEVFFTNDRRLSRCTEIEVDTV